MKWNYIKEGILPKDCELVVGISCCGGIEYIFALEYRDRERLFIVKSTEIDGSRFLREEQIKAWYSFSEIYDDFNDKDKLRNLFIGASQKEVYHPVYGCRMNNE